MQDPGTRLLLKAAQLYHVQGLNQDQIGRQLGVSRSKVSRMLKEARGRGLVEITLHHSTRFSLDLERQLEAELGLREAVVVNAGGEPGSPGLSSVASAAAEYLVRVLQPGDVLGVSGGETVSRTVQVMPANAVADVSVVQLGTAGAYLGQRVANPSAEVALHLAQKLGSLERLVLVPVPALLDSEAICDALLCDTGVRRAMAVLASCSLALVGIGAVDGMSALPRETGAPVRETVGRAGVQGWLREARRSLALTAEELAELRAVDAVGEICARFFDIQGRPCFTSLDRRLVALDLSSLRATPLVVGVAAGVRKAAAILGAARGGYVKALVTDDATAREVLALARSASTGPRQREEPRAVSEGSQPPSAERQGVSARRADS